MKEYQIFISYRRDGGEQTAKVIFDRLKDLGYNVFLDVETLRSGAFNEKLYNVIEQCTDFILVLSPGALDRCDNKNDWLRLEILHALKHNKNIIPVLLRDFSFPQYIPQEIEAVKYQNGPQASIEYFDGFIKKICSSFLKSKPSFFRVVYHNTPWRRSIAAVSIFLLIIFGILGLADIYKQSMSQPASYPSTLQEKNDVKNLLYHIDLSLVKIDTIFKSYDKSLLSCKQYISSPTEKNLQEATDQIDYTEKIFSEEMENKISLPQDLMDHLSQTKIDTADMKALSTYGETLVGDYRGTLDFLKVILLNTAPLDLQTKNNLIKNYAEYKKLDVNSIYIGLCELLMPVDDTYLKEFRTSSPSFLSIKSQSTYTQWLKDATELKNEEQSIATRQQQLLNAISQLVGNENVR